MYTHVLSPVVSWDANKQRTGETYVYTCVHTLACNPFAHTGKKTQTHKTWTTKANMWAMNLLCFETKA